MVLLIEEIYKFALFVILVENTIAISGSTYLFLFNLNHPMNLFRYSAIMMMVFVHFSILFSQGQMIINSSSSIFDACYEAKWYLASAKTRRLLFITMKRSSRPSKITGGHLFIISMETCSKMMKAGFSYLSLFTRRMS